VIDNISGLREFEVTARPDGSLALQMAQQYAVNVYYLDLDQAEALGKSLIEITMGLRENPWAASQ